MSEELDFTVKNLLVLPVTCSNDCVNESNRTGPILLKFNLSSKEYLGSLLYFANLVPIIKSIGIELVLERHNDALKLLNELASIYPNITNKVELINSNIFDINLQEKI
jgi:adenine C2-methylase RlmN of 23S rRNA A2503 and tRNA A37